MKDRQIKRYKQKAKLSLLVAKICTQQQQKMSAAAADDVEDDSGDYENKVLSYIVELFIPKIIHCIIKD